MDFVLIRRRERPLVDLSFMGSLPSGVTFARASVASRFNEAGLFESVASDVPRFDTDPVTLQPRGLLVEEQRTNYIRNNTMVGGVAGSPGTLPTYWSANALAGLTRTLAYGTEYGMSYVEIRLNGTPTATVQQILFEASNGIAGTQGVIFTQSLYVRIVGGSLTNISYFKFNISEFTSASGYLTEGAGASFGLSEGFARYTYTRAQANALAAYAKPSFCIGTTVGQAIDITLRFYAPQMEVGSFATSVIPTSTVAVTRAADFVSKINLPWFNPAAGTIYVEGVFIKAGGKMQALLSLNNGTASNQINLKTDASDPAKLRTLFSAGSYNSGNSMTEGAVQKIATSFDGSVFSSVLNGGAESSYAGVIPSGIDRIIFGANAVGSENTSFYLRAFRYWGVAKTVNFKQQVTK